jgi:hypothetical protein
MMIAPCDWRRTVVWAGVACAICVGTAGCGDPLTNSGIAHPGNRPSGSSPAPATNPAAGDSITPGTSSPSAGGAQTGDVGVSQQPAATDPAAAQVDPTKPPTFEAEGPDGALRVTFGDLDLLKLLNMQTITSDCVEKLPDWLKGLAGKKVRIRGYMKPSTQSEGIPEFVFVRSTDLCCFEPKGRVDHLVATKLKPGSTTDYIALKPFDVVGTFRIELVQFDDGLIILLYHVDDATIIR